MGYHFGHEYADETLVDAANEVAKDERREKLLKAHLGRRLGEGVIHIKPRTLPPNCPQSFAQSGWHPHRLVITQGESHWYKEHGALGTEFHAVCKLCGAEDSWITAFNERENTGMVSHG